MIFLIHNKTLVLRGTRTLGLCLATGVDMTIETPHKCSMIPILRQMHRKTPNWYWTPQGERYSPMLHFCHRVATFNLLHLWTAIFELQAILRQMHWMIQIDLEHNKVKSKCVTSVPESQVSTRFAPRRAIFELQDIFRKVQNDIEHYKVTGIPDILNQYFLFISPLATILKFNLISFFFKIWNLKFPPQNVSLCGLRQGTLITVWLEWIIARKSSSI